MGERQRERERESERVSRRKIDSGKVRIIEGESESSHDHYNLVFSNSLMSIFFFYVYLFSHFILFFSFLFISYYLSVYIII